MTLITVKLILFKNGKSIFELHLFALCCRPFDDSFWGHVPYLF